jgi:hypothetical protein
MIDLLGAGMLPGTVTSKIKKNALKNKEKCFIFSF